MTKTAVFSKVEILKVLPFCSEVKKKKKKQTQVLETEKQDYQL